MGDDGRVVGDPTEVLTRSGASSYVSLTAPVPTTDVTGPVSADSTPAPDAASPNEARAGSRFRFIGWLALTLAVVAGVLTGIAAAAAADGEFVSGTSLAWAAIVLSGIAVVGGVLAAVGGFGRLPGIAAIVLGLLANPFLLTQVLGAVQNLSAAGAVTI